MEVHRLVFTSLFCVELRLRIFGGDAGEGEHCYENADYVVRPDQLGAAMHTFCQ